MENLRKIIFSIVFILIGFAVYAQQSIHCGTTEYTLQHSLEYPEFTGNQTQLENETGGNSERYIQEYGKNSNSNQGIAVTRIIPVVFHIIHYNGPENISKAQVESALEVLNEDFKRLNADTVNTPVPFQSLGANTEIEFRLATLDPNGDCTDGIVRVFSLLTYDGSNNVKAISYWPSDQYLNVWVVSQAIPTPGQPPRTGYAQFPGGNPLTDGVVLGHQYAGRIHAAANNHSGRWISHEVGHWLNLRHIWGDGTCASDFVTDTPTHEGPNSGCATFPRVTSCNNGPNGEMFMNYMDYSDGHCMNIFTIGQSARMNTALSSSVSDRNNLWSSSNLIATGTTGAPAAICTPIAEFHNLIKNICEGTTINFKDGSWNATPDTWQWDFPGGTPSSSNDTNPSIQYNTAGTYDVTLTVSNTSGSDTYTIPASVVVSPAVGQYSIPYSEGFESITFPGTEWVVENGGGNTWTQTSIAANTGGTNSVYINNFTGNTTNTSDIFITPTYNLSNVTQANLTFWLAFAARSVSSTDQLRVFASTSCGQLWNIRYNKVGTTLSTAGIITSNFIPNASQWRQETVNIASSSYNNKPNVRFKFDYLQGNGNNIYIDDLNIDGTVGVDEVFEQSLEFSVYPNPVLNQASIEFTLTEKNNIRIHVVDVIGRIVNEVAETTLDAGDYLFELPTGLAAGLYSVRLNVNGNIVSRKVIIN